MAPQTVPKRLPAGFAVFSNLLAQRKTLLLQGRQGGEGQFILSDAVHASMLLLSMVGLDDKAVKGQQASGQHEQYQKHTQQSTAANQAAQTAHCLNRGQEVQAIAGRRQNEARGQDGQRALGDRADGSFLFVPLGAGIEVVAGHQNGVVDRRAELHARYDDKAQEHGALAVDIRQRGVDENRRLDGDEHHERQEQRLVCNRDHERDAEQRQDVDERIVIGDDVADVLGRRGHTDHICLIVGIILFHNAADFVGVLERCCTFPRRTHIDDHARPVFRMQLPGQAFGQKFFGDAGRQHVGKAHDIPGIGQRIQFFGHGFFGDIVAHRHQRQHHIAAAELFIHEVFVLVDVCAGRVGDRLVAVGKVGHALADIARNDEQQHQHGQRNADFIRKFAHLAEARQKRPVRRAVDDVLKPQDERRHEQQYGEQAANDALGQHKAHIRTNAEAHDRQRKEADHRSRARSADGRYGLPQSVGHGLFGLDAVCFFAGERMQQEDGIVHRAGQLQDRTDRIGHERDLPEKQVGAHADDDGNAHDQQKQGRFKPRSRGNHQNEEDDHNGQRHNARDLAVDGWAKHGVRRCRTGHDALALDDGLDFMHRFMGAVGGVAFQKGDVHIGIAVLVVVLDVAVIDEFTRTIDVGRGVAPQDHVDPIDLGNLILDRLGFPQRDILEHHTAHAGIGEFFLHDVERLRRRRRVGKVFGQVIVDAYKWNAGQVEDKQDQEELFDHFPLADDQLDRTPPLFFHKQNTCLGARR